MAFTEADEEREVMRLLNDPSLSISYEVGLLISKEWKKVPPDTFAKLSLASKGDGHQLLLSIAAEIRKGQPQQRRR